MFCPTCGVRQPDEHRFCFSCGARLPRELIGRQGPKESRWFPSVPVLPEDRARGALRVSRYLEEFEATKLGEFLLAQVTETEPAQAPSAR